MCIAKIRKVLMSGALSISCILMGITTYADTIKIEELVSPHFTNVATYEEDLFNDIDSSEWFKEGVQVSYELGLMSGESDKKFNPKGNLTVAQTIAIASRINAIYNNGNLEAIPNNVSGGKWYDNVVEYAKNNNIIQGTEFSQSDMNKPATRGQVAYILSNAVPNSELQTINSNVAFKDVKDNGKYSHSINLLAKSGVVTGVKEGEFSPNSKVTRAEASVFITRLVKPTSRIQVQASKPNNGSGNTVYVTQLDKNGVQYVYDKAGANLTPITVKYGKHTYNSTSQKEYDYVVGEIEKILNFEGKGGKEYKELIDNYNSNKNKTKELAKRSAYKLGIKDEDKIFELYKIEKVCAIARTLYNGDIDGRLGHSSYRQMTTGQGDCTADAMTNLAVMDAMGYNSKTVANDSQVHEWAMMEYEGQWIHLPSSGFTKNEMYNRNTSNDTFSNAQ